MCAYIKAYLWVSMGYAERAPSFVIEPEIYTSICKYLKSQRKCYWNYTKVRKCAFFVRQLWLVWPKRVRAKTYNVYTSLLIVWIIEYITYAMACSDTQMSVWLFGRIECVLLLTNTTPLEHILIVINYKLTQACSNPARSLCRCAM